MLLEQFFVCFNSLKSLLFLVVFIILLYFSFDLIFLLYHCHACALFSSFLVCKALCAAQAVVNKSDSKPIEQNHSGRSSYKLLFYSFYLTAA